MPSRIESPEPTPSFASGTIVDIGGSQISTLIGHQLLTSFVRVKQNGGRPSLPEEPLYNDEGLKIWSEVLDHPQYYQYRDETDVLVRNGREIARYIRPGTIMIDLGAGDTRKVASFLGVVDDAGIPATYMGLDISFASLKRHIAPLQGRYHHISCNGLWGSFTDLHGWISKLDDSPRLFLSLGSVLFNDARDTAIKHLRAWANQLREQDYILAGMDGHRVPEHLEKIWASYHGKGGEDAWTRFWQNGLDHVNRIVGTKLFRLQDWEILGRMEDAPVSHQFTFTAKRDVSMSSLGITFARGESFDWFDAHKNGEVEVREMCEEVGLEVVKVWKKLDSEMTEYLIKRKPATG